MTSITDTLIKYGFEPSTADLYVILANNGEMTVPQMMEKFEFSRASVYDSLSQLLAQDFVEYRKEGRVAYYKPVHPNKLFGLIEQKKRDTTLLEEEMKDSIKTLIGVYNLSENKPGVRFFEGEEGFKEALYDSLEATETIYAYVDMDALQKYAGDVNREYVKKRQENGIHKRLLVLDTPEARQYLKKQGSKATEFRFLPPNMKPFRTGMEIYDNKISYFTLRENNTVAVILEDRDIYRFHRHIFEALWEMVGNIKPKTAIGSGQESKTVFN
ncbi:MAG: helix-turn-helix domain-containing protein [Candidatus Magasanikbacteria bacterium]